MCHICFFLVISDAGSEGWLLFGALLVTQSVTVCEVLHNSVNRYMLGFDTERTQNILNTFVGLSLLAFLVHGNNLGYYVYILCKWSFSDTSFVNGFRIVSLLQLITGSVLLTNYIAKKIKYLFTR